MNKTYNAEDIISLVYRRFFLEGEEVISKERKEEQKKIAKSTGKEEFPVFDFLPVETILKNIECNGVYEKTYTSEGSKNETFIDLANNKEVTAEELEKRGGKYVIVGALGPLLGYGSRIDFTIVGKGETLDTVFTFIPNSKTNILCASFARIAGDKLYTCDYSKEISSENKQFPFIPKSTTIKEENKKEIEEAIYKNSIKNKYIFSNRLVDDVLDKLSLKFPQPASISDKVMFMQLNPVEQATYLDMLQNSLSEELQQYFTTALNSIYNYTASLLIDQRQGENFKKYYPTSSEIDKYSQYKKEEYFAYMSKQETNTEKLSQVESNKVNETKTAKQIRELSVALKQMQDVGISLSPEQEQIIYIGDKLNSEEFKEFQAKRGERLKRQQEIREKNQRENAEKEARQNSESNNRKSVLIDLKGKLEALEALKAKFPSLVSEEQDKFINEMKEFFMMYEQENTKEHEVDTGMSEESRAWYQEHYKSR